VNFELSREQKQIQKAVRDFVKGEFKKETVHRLIEKREYPLKIWKKASDLGFIGIHFPEEYSGEGLGMVEKLLITEELCRADSSVGACLTHACHGAEMVLRHGSDAQKQTWLPRIADAKILCGGAFSEPGCDGNLERVTTTAVKDGDAWVIQGTKTFVRNAGPLAGFFVVLCRTDPQAASPDKGLTTILVEADRPGLSIEGTGSTLGDCLTDTGDLHFKGVRVPLENTIGTENKGHRQAMDFFNASRLVVAAQAVGTARGAFDRALAYVKQREQFGRKLIAFQMTRNKLADMATDIEAARLLTYHGAWQTGNGRGDAALSAMAKMHASRTAVAVCDEAIQLLGGYGYMHEYDVERFFRDAKTAELLEGGKQVQKNAISAVVVTRNK
jgi:alkylation response protein AidB-like acyl-CoA dehydrogenase